MKPELGYQRRKGQSVGRLVYLFAFILALLCSCFFPAPAWADGIAGPEKVILTWTGDPATSQTVTWLTPDVNADTIQYIESERFNGDFLPLK